MATNKKEQANNMEVFIVVQEHWDHHVNMGVFETVAKAYDYKFYLEERIVGYSYQIETFQLDYATPV